MCSPFNQFRQTSVRGESAHIYKGWQGLAFRELVSSIFIQKLRTGEGGDVLQNAVASFYVIGNLLDALRLADDEVVGLLHTQPFHKRESHEDNLPLIVERVGYPVEDIKEHIVLPPAQHLIDNGRESRVKVTGMDSQAFLE